MAPCVDAKLNRSLGIEAPPVCIAAATAVAAAAASTVLGVELADTTATTASPPSVHDYSCPICLDLLLRPVVLSCDHRFCRGCWLRVLQTRDVRDTAHRTGSVACPFRCKVRPIVPEVDQTLARELESLNYFKREHRYSTP